MGRVDSLYNTYQVDGQREGRLPEELRAGEPGGEKAQGLGVQAEAGASGAAGGGVRRLLQHNHAPPRRDEGVGARQPCYAAAHHHPLRLLLLFHGHHGPVCLLSLTGLLFMETFEGCWHILSPFSLLSYFLFHRALIMLILTVYPCQYG